MKIITPKIRKWFRIIHRDLGYLFFGMTIIYGLSGIAINHLDDWNPSYIVIEKEFDFPYQRKEDVNKENISSFLLNLDDDFEYKKHFFKGENNLKIFINGGSALIDLSAGKGQLEKLKRRPIFNEVNFLHYNPGKYWTWFSDAFAVSLIVLAITGLFLIKGKKGITGRGAWITGLGILIPIIFLFILR